MGRKCKNTAVVLRDVVIPEGSEIGLQDENSSVDLPTSYGDPGCTNSTLENYLFNDSCPGDSISNTSCAEQVVEPRVQVSLKMDVDAISVS